MTQIFSLNKVKSCMRKISKRKLQDIILIENVNNKIELCSVFDQYEKNCL